jgi:hypothetical protein
MAAASKRRTGLFKKNSGVQELQEFQEADNYAVGE